MTLHLTAYLEAEWPEGEAMEDVAERVLDEVEAIDGVEVKEYAIT